MQLFILDEHPEKVPRMLCDAHVRKMCLETAQILSGVLFLRSIPLGAGMPRAYNCNHPVIRAVAGSDFKTAYTLTYNEALHGEYFYRFSKLHRYAALCPAYRIKLFPDGGGAGALSGLEFCTQFQGFYSPFQWIDRIFPGILLL